MSIEQINTDVNDILSGINNKMSTYIDDSELSLINQTGSHEWIPVSADLHQVISDAVEISTLTMGSFDITVGPLVNLWGFGPSVKGQKIPSTADIFEALSRTGIEHINLRGPPLALQKTITDIYIDLSGIAKLLMYLENLKNAWSPC